MCFVHEFTTQFSSTTFPKARKQHRCSECGATIQPGDVYYYQAGLGEDFYVWKECRRCRFDLKRVFDHEQAEGCGWSESFAPGGELGDALCDIGLERTPPAEVPDEFDIDWTGEAWREKREKEKKNER